jgi:hypothetical protein
VKVMEHGKGFSVCQHPGETWGIALANTLGCLGISASIPEEVAIVEGVMTGLAVWHRGTLLTGRSA